MKFEFIERRVSYFLHKMITTNASLIHYRRLGPSSSLNE
jgi:hypothetical protein